MLRTLEYNDIENASLEIDYLTSHWFKNFLEKHGEEIVSLNIKRVSFNISYNEVTSALKILKEYKFKHNAFDKNILIIFITSVTSPVDVDINNFLIINISDCIIKSDNCYNLIPLKDETISRIKKALSNNINIILDPVIDLDNISEFNNILDKIWVLDRDINIFLNGYLIPTSLMKEHPCNAYLCNGWYCKRNICSLPRVLYLNKRNYLYPHRIIDDRVIIGKLDKSLIDCLNRYKSSEQFELFINICKRVFIKYLRNYPYGLIPFVAYLNKELCEYDNK